MHGVPKLPVLLSSERLFRKRILVLRKRMLVLKSARHFVLEVHGPVALHFISVSLPIVSDGLLFQARCLHSALLQSHGSADV